MDEIEWSMLQGFLRSLRHHMHDEDICALAKVIGAILRYEGVNAFGDFERAVANAVPAREPILP